jgi:hypothetical protein
LEAKHNLVRHCLQGRVKKKKKKKEVSSHSAHKDLTWPNGQQQHMRSRSGPPQFLAGSRRSPLVGRSRGPPRGGSAPSAADGHHLNLSPRAVPATSSTKGAPPSFLPSLLLSVERSEPRKPGTLDRAVRPCPNACRVARTPVSTIAQWRSQRWVSLHF